MASHNCMFNRNGLLKCWGSNSCGQLGLGDSRNRGDNPNEMGAKLPFVNIGNGLSVDQVAIGNYHTCIHTKSLVVMCWGNNDNGQLGLGLSTNQFGDTIESTPDKLKAIDLGTESYPTQIQAGNDATCILMGNKKVKCFGSNQYGAIGYESVFKIGKLQTDLGDNLPYVQLGTGVEVESIYATAGALHTCVILATTQFMKCWGNNAIGQLGYGDKVYRGKDPNTMGDNLPTIDLGDEGRVKQVVLGDDFTCALRIDDKLKCWGDNFNGQFGIGSTSTVIKDMGYTLGSTQYDSGKKINQMAAGYGHLCLLFDDNLTVKCAGYNGYGELGLGDDKDRGSTPDTTFSNLSAIDLGTGKLHISFVQAIDHFTCVGFVDQSLKCFGRADYGCLGSGNEDIIGDEPYEIGKNLSFVNVFEATNAPTALNPTNHPATKFPTSKSPTSPCDYYSAKICKHDFGCMWAKIDGAKRCVVFDCTQFNQGKCGKQSKRCKWNKKDLKCSLKT